MTNNLTDMIFDDSFYIGPRTTMTVSILALVQSHPLSISMMKQKCFLHLQTKVMESIETEGLYM